MSKNIHILVKEIKYTCLSILPNFIQGLQLSTHTESRVPVRYSLIVHALYVWGDNPILVLSDYCSPPLCLSIYSTSVPVA